MQNNNLKLKAERVIVARSEDLLRIVRRKMQNPFQLNHWYRKPSNKGKIGYLSSIIRHYNSLFPFPYSLLAMSYTFRFTLFTFTLYCALMQEVLTKD